jgi:CheY-like chemotaxis protein
MKRDPPAFDLLVTDKTMPGMGGLELAEQARALCPSLPVILCTGFDDGLPGQAPLGVDRVLAKPISSQDLDAEIRRLLARAQGA